MNKNIKIASSSLKTKSDEIILNYEMFCEKENAETIIINIFKHKKDESLKNGLLRLVYKIDDLTDLSLSLTTGEYKDKKGLYFNVNFICKKTNDISYIFKNYNFLAIIYNKINKLITI